MKNKRCLAVLLLAVIVMMAFPLSLSAHAANHSDVTCTVPSEYAFAVPQSVTVLYPVSEVYLGDFGIHDLLLEQGETLSVELVAGPLTAVNNSGIVLPYTVDFNPPAHIDNAHIGQGFGVTVRIDADAFTRVRAGRYTAALSFQIRSSYGSEVIWIGTTTLAAVRRAAGFPDDPGDPDDPIDDPDETVVTEPIPRTGDTPEESEPGIILEDEVVPQAAPQSPVFAWWWLIPIVIGVLVALLLLIIVLKRRSRKQEDTQNV